MNIPTALISSIQSHYRSQREQEQQSQSQPQQELETREEVETIQSDVVILWEHRCTEWQITWKKQLEAEEGEKLSGSSTGPVISEKEQKTKTKGARSKKNKTDTEVEKEEEEGEVIKSMSARYAEHKVAIAAYNCSHWSLTLNISNRSPISQFLSLSRWKKPRCHKVWSETSSSFTGEFCGEGDHLHLVDLRSIWFLTLFECGHQFYGRSILWSERRTHTSRDRFPFHYIYWSIAMLPPDITCWLITMLDNQPSDSYVVY